MSSLVTKKRGEEIPILKCSLLDMILECDCRPVDERIYSDTFRTEVPPEEVSTMDTVFFRGRGRDVLYSNRIRKIVLGEGWRLPTIVHLLSYGAHSSNTSRNPVVALGSTARIDGVIMVPALVFSKEGKRLIVMNQDQTAIFLSRFLVLLD